MKAANNAKCVITLDWQKAVKLSETAVEGCVFKQ